MFSSIASTSTTFILEEMIPVNPIGVSMGILIAVSAVGKKECYERLLVVCYQKNLKPFSSLALLIAGLFYAFVPSYNM